MSCGNISVGYRTENEARGVKLTIGTEIPAGAQVELRVTRPGESTWYIPAHVEVQGDMLYWQPDAVDTEIDGKGTLQIWMRNGQERKALSHVMCTNVQKSIAGGEALPPDPLVPYIERVVDAADRITGMSVTVETLPPGSGATAAWDGAKGVLNLGMPTGSKGPKGDPGDPAQLIDDASAAANRAWSAGKLTALCGALFHGGKDYSGAYTCVDMLSGVLTRQNATHHGITYTWAEGTCTVSGAATSTSVNILISPMDMPIAFVPGETCYLKYKTTNENVKLRIIFYDLNGAEIGTRVYATQDVQINIPEGARRWTMCLYVDAGADFSDPAVVSDVRMLSTLTNRELAELANITKLAYVWIDETKAQEIGGTLTGFHGNTYSWVPKSWFSDSPAEIADYFWAFMISNNGHQAITNNGTLVLIDSENGHIFTKRVLEGAWTNWRKIGDIDLSQYTRNVPGLVPIDNGDLNNYTDNQFIMLNGGSITQYINSPLPNTEPGFLTVQSSGPDNNWVLQTVVSMLNPKAYKRRHNKKTGEWTAWQSITDMYSAYRTSEKYVAYGDSLTWGAVWSPTSNTPLHRVREEWRLPTRIALAVGLNNNFANEAVGGIGYWKEAEGENIVGQIDGYDFAGVSLVTIMAGANDKSTVALGTSADAADTRTICGAIRHIIQTIAAKNPKTQIIVIQPLPSGVNGATDDVWDTIPSGWKWSMNQFDEQVSKLCKDEHVGYVNWSDSTYCRNWRNVGYSGTVGPNYTHPTEDSDYYLLGNFLAGKVSSLYRGLN